MKERWNQDDLSSLSDYRVNFFFTYTMLLSRSSSLNEKCFVIYERLSRQPDTNLVAPRECYYDNVAYGNKAIMTWAISCAHTTTVRGRQL